MTVKLGSTGIVADKNGFGCLPIQRVDDATAVKILRGAYEGGVNYYDTARGYTDSEHKLGLAFDKGMREKIFIATKSHASTAEGLLADLNTSLRELNTDYIDVYQFHNLSFVPRPGDESGIYDTLLEAKRQGKIRHIGLTSHRLPIALEAVESGLYETLQFPFSYLSVGQDIALVERCYANNVGFVAMKSLSGGLISNARGAWAFMAEHPGVLPIWGIQRMEELEEFLGYQKNPPVMEEEGIRAGIERDRKELDGEFCRGCGYCKPCPMGIDISWAARIEWFVKRGVPGHAFSEEFQNIMSKVSDCVECRQCVSRCPYGLDIPELIKRHNAFYQEALAGYRKL
jgi:predicted aldo/keto reductase-like oxidoreductase